LSPVVVVVVVEAGFCEVVMGFTRACSKAQPVSPPLMHTSQVSGTGALAKHKLEAAELGKKLTTHSIQFHSKGRRHHATSNVNEFHEKGEGSNKGTFLHMPSSSFSEAPCHQHS